MPKASMHENGLLLAGDYKVRLSRQTARTTSVLNPHSSQNLAHYEFGLCSAGTNPAHYLTPLAWKESVHSFAAYFKTKPELTLPFWE